MYARVDVAQQSLRQSLSHSQEKKAVSGFDPYGEDDIEGTFLMNNVIVDFVDMEIDNNVLVNWVNIERFAQKFGRIIELMKKAVREQS